MTSATSENNNYSGWTFRLNVPNPNSSSDVSETRQRIGGGNTSGFDCSEGVQLRTPLLYTPLPSLSTSRYLAELCPRGVSVASLSSSSSNDDDDVPPTPPQSVTESNDTLPASNKSVGGAETANNNNSNSNNCWSWSYSSQSSSSQWNVTSSKLLSVTYRPVHEAYSTYTNITKSREYWNKIVGSCLDKGISAMMTCGGGKCCRFVVGRRGRKKSKRRIIVRSRSRSSWGKMKRHITGAPNPIHRVSVSYTVDDILRIEPISATTTANSTPSVMNNENNDKSNDGGVWIQGIGKCNAIRIYLRSKIAAAAGGGIENNMQQNDEDYDSISSRYNHLPDMNKWDNLPSSPWQNLESSTTSSSTECGGGGGNNEESTKKQCVYGPVITFAIPYQGDNDGLEKNAMHKCPPLLWKVDHPPNPYVAVDSFLLMDGALHLHQHQQAKDVASAPSSFSRKHEKPTNVYIHGYQSWSFSGSVVQGKDQPTSAMPYVLSAAFNRGGVVLANDHVKGGDYWIDNLGIQIDDNDVDKEETDVEDEVLNDDTAFYKSDMFTCITSNGASTSQYNDERILLDEEGGPALIVGFLAQRKQYGSILVDKELRRFAMYACHEGVVAKRGITSDWAYCQIVDKNTYDEEVLVYYVHAVGDHNEARPMEKGLTCGWCSWYHYYANISHDLLSANVGILENSMSSIDFNVCLIDDGYMTAWGDWTSLKPGKFVKDGGMRVLADTIRAKGMKPGIWLAPFACDKFSNLARDHPDWIIRNDYGRHSNSANCGKFFYGLDATNPEVLKHVYDTIRRAVDEWGFDVLKLDFLYASCLQGNGKYDPSMSRAEAMYLGLRTIRAAAGKETFIIGCGCPIGSAVGFVDGMRVSCDTGPTFVPPMPFPYWDNGTLPALRGMLRNTMSRSPFGHRWWNNDPDCILLGETTKLTDDEVVSAASVVAMTGGMFLLSDDMEKVSEARLCIAKRIFPLTSVTAVPLDLHSTMNDGMPSILRLWCSEKSTLKKSSTPAADNSIEQTLESLNPRSVLRDQSAKIECEFVHTPGDMVDPYSRERSCIRVAAGLGSWTVISFSNWLDHAARLSVSFSALVSHSIDDYVAMGVPRSSQSVTTPADSSPREISNHGFHLFSFWSSEYIWIPHRTLEENDPLIKKLKPHATEIFHIKPAEPTRPQYIGSDLHFSCGYEVNSFDWSDRSVKISLKNDYKKDGSVVVYVPESDGLNRAAVTVNGKPGKFDVVAKTPMGKNRGGSVLRVYVSTGIIDEGVVSIHW